MKYRKTFEWSGAHKGHQCSKHNTRYAMRHGHHQELKKHHGLEIVGLNSSILSKQRKSPGKHSAYERYEFRE